ncbi:MAG: hypothetical protein K2H90_09110 [Oscillospiraceae bacterium]|nr:hypothetical protein [Oscillospiraceae bacterium]
MAVVKTIICSGGVTVHIHNDFYSEITEKEMNRRISEIKELAKKIFLNAEVREINGGENLPKP